jgi:RNA polymerase sigma-70 factor (ECF subfamily)
VARRRQTEPDLNPSGGETALVLAARAGDASAFDTLVGRYQRRAVSVSYRLLGNVHDALEVSQDAFLRAWRARGCCGSSSISP